MHVETLQVAWHEQLPVLSCDFHSSGVLATAGADHEIRLWRLERGSDGRTRIRFQGALKHHSKAVNCVRFHGDQLLSTGDCGEAILWQPPPGKDGFDASQVHEWKVHHLLNGHGDDVMDAAWAPDGSGVVSASIDNTVILWDARKGKRKNTWHPHKHYIQGVAWDPLGEAILTQSADRSVRVLRLSAAAAAKKQARVPASMLARAVDFNPTAVLVRHTPAAAQPSAAASAAARTDGSVAASAPARAAASVPAPPAAPSRNDADHPVSCAPHLQTAAPPAGANQHTDTSDVACKSVSMAVEVRRTDASAAPWAAPASAQSADAPSVRICAERASAGAGGRARAAVPAPSAHVAAARAASTCRALPSEHGSAGGNAAGAPSARGAQPGPAAALGGKASVSACSRAREPLQALSTAGQDSPPLHGGARGGGGAGEAEHLFEDESLCTFFRRLAVAPDGSVAIGVAALLGSRAPATGLDHAAVVLGRQNSWRPTALLPTLLSATTCVRFCPLVFRAAAARRIPPSGAPAQQPPTVPPGGAVGGSGQGKQAATSPASKSQPAFDSGYKLVFAVGSTDSILVYDTESDGPVHVVGGVHYKHITDVAWSPDGSRLLAASNDGYCTLVAFEAGELGTAVGSSEELRAWALQRLVRDCGADENETAGKKANAGNSTTQGKGGKGAQAAKAAVSGQTLLNLPFLKSKAPAASSTKAPSTVDVKSAEAPEKGDLSEASKCKKRKIVPCIVVDSD